MIKITTKQEETLSFIGWHIKEYSRPPTIREMSEAFKVNPNAIQGRIKGLVSKGVLSHVEGEARHRWQRRRHSASGAQLQQWVPRR